MRKRRRPLSQINVIPYIDVMLVLLVSFVITAPMLTTGVKVDLPDAPAKAMDTREQSPPETLVVTITEAGQLTLQPGDNQPISKAALARRATAALTQTPELAVFVRADHALAYGEVVEVMVILQQAGADKVGLITDPPATGGAAS